MTVNKFPPRKKLIYLITTGELLGLDGEPEREWLSYIRLAIDLNIPLIQLREKRLSTRDLYRLAEKAAAITRGTGTKLLINDRADVAAAVGAAGVHLTSGSLPVGVVRNAFPQLFIGVSTHNEAELMAAAENGADLAVFGPVFDSPGKGEPHGIVELSRLCSMFPSFPIIGLGGIDENNFHQVLTSGAAGIAAIRWLNDKGKLTDLAFELGYAE